MARALRPDNPDSWHHVMNHGIRDHPIFGSDRDRRLFLRCVVDAAAPTATDVAAFCLMGNHFHLVLHNPEGGVSEFMHRACGRYARTFNRIHGFEGSLFRGRFNSVLIKDDPQLVATTRYVHRNPLELGQRIETHPWSSYSTYLGERPRPWLCAEPVLRLVGGPAEYRRVVEASWPSDQFSISDGVRSVAASGQERSLAHIFRSVDSVAASGTKPRDRRAAAVIAALDVGGYPSAVIADHVGLISASSVRSLAARARLRLGQDQAFTALVQRAVEACDKPAA